MHVDPNSDPYDVVLVDDAPDVRAVVGTHLRLSGRFRVVAEGATGSDALDLVSTHQPALVLLDASMPGSDGLEVLGRLRDRCPKTRVVVFSGFDSPALAETAAGLGAVGFIEKATPISELADRLLEIIEHDDETGERRRDAEANRTAEFEMATIDGDAVLSGQAEAFRMFFDQAAIGMATVTLAGRLARVNGSLARILGCDEHALVGRHYAELAGAGDGPTIRNAVDEVARGASEAAEFEHSLVSDVTRSVHTILSVVRDPSGRPLYLFVQAEDVTARRRVLHQLRESEERFRLLIEGVRDYAIFMLNTRGEVTTWNAGAERMKGYRAEEIIGQHFRIFYPPAAQNSRHPEHELELAIRDGRYEEEGWRLRKDGTRFWASVVITALRDHDGRLAGFGKVTRDITERRLASQAREQAAQELAEANARLRMAADKTAQFVAVTAHELQSPVATMTGAATLLLEHGAALGEDERVELLQMLTRGGAWLRRLLDDLLLASRLETGAFQFRTERVDLATIVEHVLSQTGRDDVDVEIDQPCIALADPTRVTQILTNLVTNAEKYGEPPIRIVAQERVGAIDIHVSDSGGGVPLEMEPRLFEKFARGAQQGGQGTGLGLFIVRELARGQGGDAWYERGDGGSPSFVVRLPAAT